MIYPYRVEYGTNTEKNFDSKQCLDISMSILGSSMYQLGGMQNEHRYTPISCLLEGLIPLGAGVVYTGYGKWFMMAIRVRSTELGSFCVIFTFCGMVAGQTLEIPQEIPSCGPYNCFHSLCSGKEVKFLHGKWQMLLYFGHIL